MTLMLKRVIIIVSAAALLSGCSFVEKFDSRPDMTSPCVGLEDSPCGPKRAPEHQWLMNYEPLMNATT